MPPTSTDTGQGGRRGIGRLGAGLLAAALVVPVTGMAAGLGGRSHRGGQTLRSAALAVTVDADRLARDRASRSASRNEIPVPPQPVTVVHDGTRQR
ncbi:MAG TPA: hypothetical protein VEN99_06015, partial [Acidimicrobiia bacterium]|nr:hypothetical protein [Acidimicrobiia bacterium]